MCVSFGPPILDGPKQLYRTTSIRAERYVYVCAHMCVSHTWLLGTISFIIMRNWEQNVCQQRSGEINHGIFI